MINTKNLFRVEWKTTDNANAMVEPTTVCQLRCPKCYRGVGEPGYRPEHVELSLVKKEIDTLKKIRNIETVTLAGGDPLLYPHLVDLIKYCRAIGVKVRICTNAVALSKEMLAQLEVAGANEILIHLDSYQGRGSEDDIYELREGFCRMFRDFPRVNLGFMTMIHGVQQDNLDKLTSFYVDNADVIRLVSFIFTKEALYADTKERLDLTHFDELNQVLSLKYACRPAAYLGKKINKNIPSWLVYIPVFSDIKLIGHIDNVIYGISSKAYRFFRRKYWFLTNKDTIKPYKLLLCIFNRNVRKILANYLKDGFKKNFSNNMHYQIITVNFGPDLTQQGWDLCDPCPDAILYQGKLVPSCLLERIKRGEGISF